jgi:lipoprotein-releasing system permease protein
MKFSKILKFSWRYFKAKKSTNAVNIISWVSVTAIMVGTASLIIILSAFNGFESLVKSLYASYYADLRISPAKGKVLVLNAEQLEKIRQFQGVKNIARSVEEKALLQNESLQTIVSIKGIDSQYKTVAAVHQKMYRGEFNTGTSEKPGLVMGVGVEQALGLVSDRSVFPLSIYLPKKGSGLPSNPLDALGMATAYPTGSFAIQSEFDNKYVLTDLEFLKSYLNYNQDEYSYVELGLVDYKQVAEVKKGLKDLLGSSFLIEDRYEQNRSLYATIRLEKFAIYAIFSLILIVAAFNMVGALSMLVLEKQKDIQILQAMGAARGMIRKIFLAEGLLLAFIGTFGGVLISLLLYYLQIKYKLVPLEGASFVIDYYPVKLVLGDFIAVVATVFVIGILASWFPSARAARQTFDLHS